MGGTLKALTGDDEIDDVLRYLRGCDTQDRAARLTAENVHALVSLFDHLFTATALVPAVRAALIDLLRVARSDKLVGLLAQIDPHGDIGRLAEVA